MKTAPTMAVNAKADRYLEVERQLWDSIGVQPVQHRVHLKTNDVWVRVQQVGQGPPLLFIHGANTCGASWARLATLLPDFRCLLLDRPGTGMSDPLQQVLDVTSIRGFGESLVPDVLDAMGLKTADVVATSLGGYMALRSAAAHPERIGCMVQLSWPVGASSAKVPTVMRVMTAPVIGKMMSAIPPTRGSIKMIFRQLGHGPSLKSGAIADLDIDSWLAMMRFTETTRNENAMGRSFFSLKHGLNPRLTISDGELGMIATPTQFLWGGKDPLGALDTAHHLASMMPYAQLEVMPEAGHAPWLDDPEHVADSMRSFLS